MPTLSEGEIGDLLEPYLSAAPGSMEVPARLFQQLSLYLDLLVRWNGRTNLTAVRDPQQMVKRHFGESLFAGACLRAIVGGTCEVLDLGSGAGFPGLPVQLLVPEWQVVLAESQGKKAAFLREVVRTLDLRTEVWAGRVEDLPQGRMFGAVTLRAVDRMGAMVRVARSRVRASGILLEMTGEASEAAEVYTVPERTGSFVLLHRVE